MHNLFCQYIVILTVMLTFCQDVVSQTETPDCDEVELVKYPIAIDNPLACGKNAVWDFSHTEVIDQRMTQKISIVQDSIPLVYSSERGVLSCFQMTPEGILEKSYESTMMKMTYERRPLQVVFPLEYNKTFRGLYSAIGTYCDKVKMRVFGSYDTQVTGKGTLILPDGDTLRNAVCVECSKFEHTLFYPRYVDLESWHFTQDSILKYSGMPDIPCTIPSRCFLFAPGIPYPIITYTYSSEAGKSIRQSYYYPPEEQPSSASQLSEIVAGAAFHDTPNPKSLQDVGFKYQFMADASTHKVVVDYTCDSPCEVSVLLCNSSGIVFRQQERHGDTKGEISLDYGSLPYGQYVVYIKCGMDTYVEKFSHR